MTVRYKAVGGVAVAAVLAGGLLATSRTALEPTTGPTRVSGTTASAVYPYGDGPVREVRYVDRWTLTYTFAVRNTGLAPVVVTGLGDDPARERTLLRPRRLVRASDGASRFTVAPGESRRVRLSVLMTGCEHVSSRAGSLLEEVRVDVRSAGMVPRSLTVSLPERLHTGSPRDAGCPRSSSATRSPG